MNRKLALLCACIGLSAASFGCDDDIASLFTECSNPGELRCVDNTQQVCAVTNWSTVTTCPYGCSGTTCALPNVDGAECIVTLCKDSTTLSKCSQDFKITEEKCGEGMECIGDMCQPKKTDPDKVCTEDAKECVDESHYRVCSDNAWGEAQKCSDETPVCVKGECTAATEEKACSENERQCTDASHYQLCNDETGQWGEEQACSGDTPICESGVCVVDSGEKTCSENERRCADESHYQLCDVETGQWGEPQSCDTDMICGENGECVPQTDPSVDECQKDEKTCSADKTTLRECVDGHWKDTVCETIGAGYVCDASLQCVSPSTAVCNPGEIECTKEGSNKTPGIYKICKEDGSGWETDKECAGTTPICDSGVTPNACVSKCQNNSTRCSSDGIPQKCTNGKWKDMDACADNEKCSDGKCLCIEGATKCDTIHPDWIRTCNADGSWGEAKGCPNNSQICDSGISPAACVDHCEVESERCSADGIPQKCIKNYGNPKWKNMDACGDNETCKLENNKAICVCSEGSRQCLKNEAEVCQNGSWVTEEYCKLGCDSASATCYECSKDGQVNCSDSGVFQICKNRKWVDIEDCGADKNCSTQFNNYGCCSMSSNNVCSDDQSSVLTCKSKVSDINNIKYYGWTEFAKCTDGICSSDKTGAFCGCKSGTPSYCDGQVLNYCVDNKWFFEECADNTTCDPTANACVCETGTYSCKDGKRLYCNNQKWENAKEACSKSEQCNEEEGGICITPNCFDTFLSRIPEKELAYALKETGAKKEELGIACDGKTLLTCSEGKYVVKSECKGYCAHHNSGFAYCGDSEDCTLNLQRCDITGVMTCRKGKWNVSKTCAKSQVCIETTSLYGKTNLTCVTEKCDNNTYSCSGNFIAFCSNNKLESVADCESAGLVCKDGHCVSK